ncbi:MAG: permease prefix domain 1-containing protein [Treponema sp.]|jgi:hypothetical protein|nr:permease prefix domain 1-containing protein [Treponema sp.]
MNRTKEFVDSLFGGYEESAQLSDFKEELAGNLGDKIAGLIKGGLNEEEAFAKAAAELGDISVLADEISLKKKQEVLGEAYMNIRHYMNSKRVAAYVISGAVLVFGVVSAVIALFAQDAETEIGGWGLIENSRRFSAFFGVLLPFVSLSAAGFAWLGLTQELPALYPLPKKRALWYAAAVFFLTAGIILFPLTWFSTGTEYSLIGAMGILIPFVIPSVGLLAFLGLTEKDRLKPWMKLRHEAEMKKSREMFSDPLTSVRFGVFSGAIWAAAIGLFVLFGFITGFKYSWPVFLFAAAVQLLVQGLMMKNAKKGKEK